MSRRVLDRVMRRADARDIGGIVPARADARQLPFADGSFDSAYLVTALGEIPDQLAALRELRRVLRPEGRLVVGEFFDRHYVPLVTLLRCAGVSGFEPAMRLGTAVAYLARLRPVPFASR